LKKEVTLVQLEKEKLQTIQIEDQIQHYQAQSHNISTLELEIKNKFMKTL
jgi:hypothetical protein